MPKPRPKRTSAELLAAWEHVGYEIDMYADIRSMPAMKQLNADNSGRAHYESLAIHVRNAIDFLCLPVVAAAKGEPIVHEDDVIASDFVAWTPQGVGILRRVRNSIVNNEVTHFTYKRVPGGTPWRWRQLWRTLDPLYARGGKVADRDSAGTRLQKRRSRQNLRQLMP